MCHSWREKEMRGNAQSEKGILKKQLMSSL